MTSPDKLMSPPYTLEQLEYFANNPINHMYMRDMAKQLLDIMHENERLHEFCKCFGVAHDSEGAKVVQSAGRKDVLAKYKALSNKDSSHG